jgi:hypothetical protein
MTILGKYFETESLGRDQYQTTIGLKPINYQDGSIWKRIVNNWGDSGIGERPHIVTAAPFIASVSPDGLRRIHPTRENDIWFEMSGAKINNAGTWEVVQLGTPTSRVDNRITWNRTNYNAYMDMAGHYVKLGYLLKNGYLPPNNQFAYEVATNGLTRAGGVFSKDGVPVMHMRKPVAYDYDNPDDVRQIAHEIVRIDGKWHVVFTLPSLAGMSKPLIDPTLTLQPDAAAGKDTYLDSLAPDSDESTTTIFKCDNDYIWNSLFEFDVSPIAGETISSASLSLWSASTFSGREIRAYPILVANNGWLEIATWNYADGATASQRWAGDTGNDGGADAGCSQSGTDFDATFIGSWSLPGIDNTEVNSALTTSAVQAWVDGENYGATLRAVGTAPAYYDTSDSVTTAQRPKLVINYGEAEGAGARILNLMPMRRKRRVL